MTRIYVDDSGDPGVGQRTASPFFFIGASAIEKPLELEQSVNRFKCENGLRSSELKFERLSDELRVKFLTKMQMKDFHLHFVRVDKEQLGIRRRGLKGPYLYRQVVLYALENSIGESMVELVTIDKTGCRGQPEKDMITFFKRGLNNEEVRRARDVRFRDSKKELLLQFADMMLGAAARWVRNDDDRFRRIIQAKMTSYEWPE